MVSLWIVCMCVVPFVQRGCLSLFYPRGSNLAPSVVNQYDKPPEQNCIDIIFSQSRIEQFWEMAQQKNQPNLQRWSLAYQQFFARVHSCEYLPCTRIV